MLLSLPIVEDLRKEGRYLSVALLVSFGAGASFVESIANVVASEDCCSTLVLLERMQVLVVLWRC